MKLTKSFNRITKCCAAENTPSRRFLAFVKLTS